MELRKRVKSFEGIQELLLQHSARESTLVTPIITGGYMGRLNFQKIFVTELKSF